MPAPVSAPGLSKTVGLRQRRCAQSLRNAYAGCRSALFHREHIVVELLLLDPEPLVLVVEEFLPGIVDRLELRVFRGGLVVKFVSRLVAGVEAFLRERPQLGAVRGKAAQRGDVVG